MAEGWVRFLGGDLVNVDSAGIEAHGKNPYAISVMLEAGVDISGQDSSCVDDDMLERAGLVITVCGHADKQCPALPDSVRKIYWPLADPARVSGTEEEILQQFRQIRDEVRNRVAKLLEDLTVQQPWT